ncbi:ankyrin repeat domain-containing protein [Verticillium alfalfae VaMs.102]|uniref:Ankyrin repeat domain-containing protein n=1 Tax=Verticillium alfalfae (strain VaMs.102 / ATCC MYA-4576 / FGSC 10136) TaxID=526221 RepID=C9SHU4_VERA1|nr:ankyrin repeat domain-containing protein [Verticillium alfalfae VaMs.102]EEY18517.1 ankyrin repeat domain-containing protein [Verticillium alfalfae VaMs.102]
MPEDYELNSKRRKVHLEVLGAPKSRVTIRIDRIPKDEQRKTLLDHLNQILDRDDILKTGVNGLSLRVHSIAPFSPTTECATVSFEASLPSKDLASRLGCAGSDFPYQYSHDFDGLTPLYSCPGGAELCSVIAVPGLGSHALGSWKTPGSDQVWLRDFLPQDLPKIRVLIYGYDTTLQDSASKQCFAGLGCTLLEELVDFRTRDSRGEDGVLRKDGPKRLLVTRESATSTGLVGTADQDNVEIPADHSGLVKFRSQDRGSYRFVLKRLSKLAKQPPNKVSRKPAETMMHSTQDCLKALAFSGMNSRQHDIKRAAEHTCEWLREHQAFKEWSSLRRGMMWIAGHPGSGKSTLMKHARDLVEEVFKDDALTISFYFHNRGSDLQKNLLGLFRSILHQVLELAPKAVPELPAYYHRQTQNVSEEGEKWEWDLNQLQDFFKLAITRILSKDPVNIFIDALDEAGEPAAADLITYISDLISKLSGHGQRLSVCCSCRYYPNVIPECDIKIHLQKENRNDIIKYVQHRLSTATSDPHLEDLVSTRANGSFMWARLVSEQVLELTRQGETLRKIYAEIERLPSEVSEIYREVILAAKNYPNTLRLLQWTCFSQRPLTIYELQWALALEVRTDWSMQQCQESENFVPLHRLRQRINALSCGLIELVDHGDRYETRHFAQFIHQTAKDFVLDYGILLLSATSRSLESAKASLHCIMAECCLQYLTAVLFRDDIDDLLLVTENTTAMDAEARVVAMFPMMPYAAQSIFYHMRYGQEIAGYAQNIMDILQRPDPNFCKALVKLKPWRESRGHSLQSPKHDVGPVHVASASGLTELLSRLLVNFSLSTIDQESKGRTPLSLAAEFGRADVVRMLLATGETKVNAVSKHQWTAAHWAASYGHETVMKHLIETEAMNFSLKNKRGLTAAFLAIDKGHEGILKLLIRSNRLDLRQTDREGRTLLSHACTRSIGAFSTNCRTTDKTIIQLLLKKCPSTIASRTAWTGPRYSMHMLCLETVPELIEEPDNGGRTPLSWAASNTTYDCANVLGSLLRDSRTNKFSVDKNGATLLHHAAANVGHRSTEVVLKTVKLDLEAKDSRGRTPLFWAVRAACNTDPWSKHSAGKSVEELIEHGADVNSKDFDSRTPLHWAMNRRDYHVVRILVQSGNADIHSKDKDGHSPLSLALQARPTTAMEQDKQSFWSNSLRIFLETCSVDVDEIRQEDKDFWSEWLQQPLHEIAAKGLALTKSLIGPELLEA